MHGIRYVPPKFYRTVGEQIKVGIGILLVNISRTIEKMEREKRRRLSKLGQELNIEGL
jgi:hypothetical protein